MEERDEARWEDLGGGVGVWVTKDCGITTDTLLLARFSQPRPGEACADFGTGCGAIPLLWKSQGAFGTGSSRPLLAVEIREEAAALCARSVERNGLSQEIRAVRGDVRRFRELFPPQKLDLVVCNPPYYPLGSGGEGEGPRKTARHEETLTLSDLAAAAKHCLRWGGRLCLCLRTERLAEALELFRGSRLEPKRLRLVQSGPEKAPYLFLLECRRGGKPGLAAEPTLILKPGERLYGEPSG